MNSILRLAVLAGAAYLVVRYWERQRQRPGASGADIALWREPLREAGQDGQHEAQHDAQHEALAPLGGLRATLAGQTPLPVAPELHTS
jgi:hypothetical protein